MLCSTSFRSGSFLKFSRLFALRNLSASNSVTMPEVAGEKRPADGEKEDGPEVSKKAKVEEESDQMNSEQKLKCKKYAMCITYCGKNYFGLQRNHGMPTIEGDLLTACYEAGYITEDNYNHPQGMQFQRAARTDKGVSAIRQVLSMKLPTTKGEPEQIVADINKYLVDQIRVVGLKRVTKNFNSKNNADARTYLYVCPTFAFTPKDETPSENYRISPEKITEINEIIKKYLGCHNFHNFTSGRLPSDASSKRYIQEIDCGNPFVVNDIEYVQFRIRGQSFMLHQIRKMVGVVIGIVKGYTSSEFIDRAFGKEKLDVPKAPPLGLMLDQVHYTRYDNRYCSDGSHEPITWTEHQNFIHEFKQKHILPNIWTTEEKKESMMAWLEELKMCQFDLAREHESVSKNIIDAPEESGGDDDDDDDDRVEEEIAKN